MSNFKTCVFIQIFLENFRMDKGSFYDHVDQPNVTFLVRSLIRRDTVISAVESLFFIYLFNALSKQSQ